MSCTPFLPEPDQQVYATAMKRLSNNGVLNDKFILRLQKLAFPRGKYILGQINLTAETLFQVQD